MEKIINALLFLSENTTIKDGEKIILNDIISKVISAHDWTKKIHYVEVQKNVIVYKNAILLEQVIKNLLENAMKYSMGDTVFIEIDRSKFTVSNTVEQTIEHESLKKIFEPFYKIDESRSTP